MSFSSTAAEVKAKVEGGKRSVQPFGGDGPHVDAATTPDASAPLTSTPKEEHISTRSVQPATPLNGRSSQGIRSGIPHDSASGTRGKLIIA